MATDKAWERAEKETNERHWKWTPVMPTITVIFVSGIVCSLAASIVGLEESAGRQLATIVTLGLGALVWLIERSMLKARNKMFNDLYFRYRDEESR
ncbi:MULTISPECIES: hypothetical protein [Sinorhizobium]|uniref:hypothetical protein n=1 Tax=Sinorhizobium TaxID=28105 RepID=UPI00067FE601|nr:MULTISPECIES: hypothetical protein [Sinorhizobium]ASY55407.1 hypothetical protein SS05631_c04510 [Sinorhizobium sp. CCBAU 05631]